MLFRSVTLYEDQWHEVLEAKDGTTRIYLGDPRPEIHQFDEEPPPPVYEEVDPAEERPKTPSSRHSSETSAESVTEPLELDTQIRNSPFVEHTQLAPSPHHTTGHRDTLSSPLHQNQTTEPSSQSVPIQSQPSLPITMSGTTTIASTTTTIPSGTGGVTAPSDSVDSSSLRRKLNRCRDKREFTMSPGLRRGTHRVERNTVY